MASRDDFDDFLDDDDDAPVADTRADGRLLRVPVARLSPNLVNPRTDFGTEDDLIDFGKSLQRRQNQACPIVSRAAYLKLWPENADRIGHVDYVLVSGERRYRAANAVGLAALNCVVNDDFAADRKSFMEAVVSENVDRQNFDPVEEAYAVQALVVEFGTNRAVAQHFERADGWVTQRILLTHLAPELQVMVRKKKIPLEFARHLGKLTRDNGWSAQEQEEWWADKRRSLLEEAEERKATKKAAKAARSSSRPTGTAGKGAEPGNGTQPIQAVSGAEPKRSPLLDRAAAPPAVPQRQESFTAVKPEGPAQPAGGQREPDADDVEASAPNRRVEITAMPWSNPSAVLRIAREHMDPADFERMVKEANELV